MVELICPLYMRVLSRHISPLDRQVQESLNIIKASKIPEESLNLKSEWGGSKLPDLQVSRPKGTNGPKQLETKSEEERSWRQERHRQRQGEKRVWDQSPSKGRPGKRMRDTSPEQVSGSPEWMRPPTFLTAEEREAKYKPEESQNQGTPPREPEIQDPRPETREPENQAWSPEVLQDIVNPWSPESSKTPVREIVKDIVVALVKDVVRTRTREPETRDPKPETQDPENQVWSPEVLQKVLKPWSPESS